IYRRDAGVDALSHLVGRGARAARGHSGHRGRARSTRLDGDIRRDRHEHARHCVRAGAASARVAGSSSVTPARGDASLIVLSLLPGAPGPVLISAVDTYRIAKERLDVTLTLIGGEVVEGRIFVPAPLLGHSGQLDPAAVFNDRDAFFPLELADGEVLLMCKA